jgi:hypothetical protein
MYKKIKNVIAKWPYIHNLPNKFYFQKIKYVLTSRTFERELICERSNPLPIPMNEPAPSPSPPLIFRPRICAFVDLGWDLGRPRTPRAAIGWIESKSESESETTTTRHLKAKKIFCRYRPSTYLNNLFSYLHK